MGLFCCLSFFFCTVFVCSFLFFRFFLFFFFSFSFISILSVSLFFIHLLFLFGDNLVSFPLPSQHHTQKHTKTQKTHQKKSVSTPSRLRKQEAVFFCFFVGLTLSLVFSVFF